MCLQSLLYLQKRRKMPCPLHWVSPAVRAVCAGPQAPPSAPRALLSYREMPLRRAGPPTSPVEDCVVC
jgi:hypothetical protein